VVTAAPSPEAADARPRLLLCADDYGIAPGVGVAIRELAAAGRLSAVSCMTVSPHWQSEARLLNPLEGRAGFGLHLTLTDQVPLGPMPRLAPDGRLPSPGRLLRDSLTGRLDGAEIAAEIERQIDAFAAAVGCLPSFVDGHHHVHQLPGVGDRLLDLIHHRLGPDAWVRYCDEPLPALWARGISVLKAGTISLLGRPFARAGYRLGVPGNSGFRGAYDFTDRISYDRLFARFLAPPRDGMLVMCHPGLTDAALVAADRVTGARDSEYRFLRGPCFAAVLDAAGVRLVTRPSQDATRVPRRARTVEDREGDEMARRHFTERAC
jgi:predicted glycoside hydrolase/deacetylase ChbG (UPF0249 family)